MQVITDAKEFAAVRAALSDAGLPIDDSHSGLAYLPLSEAQVRMQDL